MPRIIKTTGIVLNVQRWRETSKLVTIFTEDYGKLIFLAKGARRLKSQFGGALEVFNRCVVIFYHSERKTIYTLSSAYLLEDFSSLKSITKFIPGYELLEIILRGTKLEEPSFKLYNLLLSALRILNQNNRFISKHLQSFLASYYLKAISILGYRPELNQCVKCRLKNINYFSISAGGAICNTERHPELQDLVPARVIKPMRFLLTHSLTSAFKLQIPEETFKLIHRYCEYYLETQLAEAFDVFFDAGDKK